MSGEQGGPLVPRRTGGGVDWRAAAQIAAVGALAALFPLLLCRLIGAVVL